MIDAAGSIPTRTLITSRGRRPMEQLGKLILALGALLVLLGLAVWGLGKAGFRGLPGDFRYEGENFRFYFPIATCIVVSLILTLLLWLWQWIRRG